MIETLDSALADVFQRLGDAACNRRSLMHTPTVATDDADLRIMVLRGFDPQAMTLRFHTDARSPKALRIGTGASVGVLFYDRDEGMQIRCRGRSRVETTGEAVDAAWSGSDPYARRCYLGAAPGEPAREGTSGLPEWVEGRKPSEDDLAPARANFALLLVELDEIDWYALSHQGHRRALFRRREGWAGTWLTP